MKTAMRTDTDEIIAVRDWLAMRNRPAMVCPGMDPDGNPCRQPATLCAEDAPVISPHWRATHIDGCDYASRRDSTDVGARTTNTQTRNRHHGHDKFRVEIDGADDTQGNQGRTRTHDDPDATGTRSRITVTGEDTRAKVHNLKLRTLLRRLMEGSLPEDATLLIPGIPEGNVNRIAIPASRIRGTHTTQSRLYYGRVQNTRENTKTGSTFLNFYEGKTSVMIKPEETSNPEIPETLDKLVGCYILAKGIIRYSHNDPYVVLDHPIVFAHMSTKSVHRATTRSGQS